MSGGGPETWAYRYYDLVETDPRVVGPVDVLAAGALHPGLSRHDLAFFVERAEVVDNWLAALPLSTSLDAAGDDVLARLAEPLEWREVALASVGGGTVLVSTTARAATVAVSAPSEQAAIALAEEIRGRVPAPEGTGTVAVRLWHLGAHGSAQATDRRIEAPAWPDVERNFPRRVRERLLGLMGLDPPARGGRLLLWHGDPGTGKTTALPLPPAGVGAVVRRSVRHRSRAAVRRTGLHRRGPDQGAGVAPGAHADGRGPQRCAVATRLAEDSDEFLRASARRDAGAALGRLLNVADGVLGQGSNTLVLLTTNEALSRLHPAVVRPRRCLAQGRVHPLPRRRGQSMAQRERDGVRAARHRTDPGGAAGTERQSRLHRRPAGGSDRGHRAVPVTKGPGMTTTEDFGRPVRVYFEGQPGDWAVSALGVYCAGTLDDGQTLYTGARFEQFANHANPHTFTASDVVAVSMLSVTVPPRAAIRLVSDGAADEWLPAIPADEPIWTVEPSVLEEGSAAWELWHFLRDFEDMNRVTAGKLMAAKRPQLIPDLRPARRRGPPATEALVLACDAPLDGGRPRLGGGGGEGGRRGREPAARRRHRRLDAPARLALQRRSGGRAAARRRSMSS